MIVKKKIADSDYAELIDNQWYSSNADDASKTVQKRLLMSL